VTDVSLTGALDAGIAAIEVSGRGRLHPRGRLLHAKGFTAPDIVDHVVDIREMLRRAGWSVTAVTLRGSLSGPRRVAAPYWEAPPEQEKIRCRMPRPATRAMVARCPPASERRATPVGLTQTPANAIRYLATNASTDGELGLYERRHEAAGPGPHDALSPLDLRVVLRAVGRGALYDGEDWIAAGPGDFLFVPVGGLHAFKMAIPGYSRTNPDAS
jgi:hypothetical protein